MSGSPSAPSPIAPLHAATVVVVRPGAGPDSDGAGLEVFMLRRSSKSQFMPSTLVFPGGRLEEDDGACEEDSAWETAARRECREEAGLDLHVPLRWFDTWLTPSAEPRRRYLARFYWALLGADEGQHAQADGHETHAGRWATVRDHLGAWDRQEIDLPPPTLSILLRLSAAGRAGLERLAQDDPSPPILPKYLLSKGEHFIVMPHDPTYPEVPGEALPAPARVLGLPQRFRRDDRVWRPCET